MRAAAGRENPSGIEQELRMTIRRRSLAFALSMSIACATFGTSACASERAGDATTANELQQYVTAAAAAQQELLGLCEAASGEEQFDLYWAHNQSTGTWLQVEFLRSLLEQARASLPPEEQTIRATLRDEALFTLWELEQNIAHPRREGSQSARFEFLRLDETLRSLLRGVQPSVKRLSVEQQ